MNLTLLTKFKNKESTTVKSFSPMSKTKKPHPTPAATKQESSTMK